MEICKLQTTIIIYFNELLFHFRLIHLGHIQSWFSLGSWWIPTHTQWYQSSQPASQPIIGLPSSGLLHWGHIQISLPSASTKCPTDSVTTDPEICQIVTYISSSLTTWSNLNTRKKIRLASLYVWHAHFFKWQVLLLKLCFRFCGNWIS